MAVSNWKNGTMPRPDTLARIAQVLGVDQQFLLAGASEQPTKLRARSVGQVIDDARREIAAMSGMPLDRVRIRVEYDSE
jgi:transcriptional regulator with XRE-family HTH domain